MGERRKSRFPVPGTGGEVHAARGRRRISATSGPQAGRTRVDDPRLVALRHHASLWVAPAVLLVAALLPWPYGYYGLLRLVVFAVGTWIAYEQWRFDDAVSGWVVAFGGVALLYNPIMPVHLTREIWSVLNVATAVLFLAHLGALRKVIAGQSNEERQLAKSIRRLGSAPGSLRRRLSFRRPVRSREVTSRDRME